MADIAKLVARLELQSTQFQTELEKTNKKLLGFQRQSTASLKGIEASFKSFYRVMQVGLAGVGVGALAGIAKGAINAGDELNKAAIKAGVTGQAISELAHAAKMSDVSLEELSTSLRFMQVNLSKATDGSKEQLKAFTDLGLSIEQLKRLAPDKQFELLAGRIASIKDPAEKARAAVEIFGRAGANLLPLFANGAAGIRAAREEAQKLGVSLSDEQIKKLAEADDAIKRLSASWKGFAQTMTSAVAPALSGVLDILNELVSGKAFERVGEMQARSAIMQYGTEQQKAALLARENEAKLGGKFSGPTQRSTPGSVVPGPKGAGENGIPSVFLEEVRTTALAYDEFQKRLADQSAMDDYITGLQDAYETQRSLFEASDAGIEDLFKETTSSIKEGLDDIADKSMETNDTMSEFAKSAAQNMQSHFADFLFDPFDGGVKGMLKGFVDTIRRMVAEAAAAKVFEGLFGKSGGASGAIGGFLSGLFGGARANGGPVSSGKAYLVGERGPEMFMPGASGSIAPNGMGSVSIVNNIDARGATREGISALPEILKRNNESVKAEIIDGLRRKKYAI